jgi:predicted phage tail protein
LTASASGSSATLTWTAPAAGGTPTGYLLDVGSASGLSNLGTYGTGSAATQFSASGIAFGTYYLRVRATNGAGSGSASNEAVLTIGCAPAAPTGLRIVTNAGGSVVLTWNAVSGASRYIVEAGSASGLANLANMNLGGDTTLTAGGVGRGTYYVRVRGVGACGQAGAASSEIVLIVS